MTDPVSLIDRYIAMWNALDAEDRRDLIASAWVMGWTPPDGIGVPE